MKNYFSNMMSEGYDILVSKEIVWPKELEKDQKIELLNQAIKYFTEVEEYRKCAILQTKINDIENPPKRKRGRPRKNSEI